jgi:hypothetical protein
LDVIPACAGIEIVFAKTYLKIAGAQIFRHTRESGYPEKVENNGFPFARE